MRIDGVTCKKYVGRNIFFNSDNEDINEAKEFLWGNTSFSINRFYFSFKLIIFTNKICNKSILRFFIAINTMVFFQLKRTGVKGRQKRKLISIKSAYPSICLISIKARGAPDNCKIMQKGQNGLVLPFWMRSGKRWCSLVRYQRGHSEP